jgi:hypothetical protein
VASPAYDDSPFDPQDFEGRDVPELRELPPPAPLPLAPPKRTRSPRVAVPPEHAHQLQSQVRLLVGAPVELRVHDNRSTMISFRRYDDRLHLRVHHMFLEAGPEVVRALAEYARVRSAKAGRVLDQFVRQHRENIRPVEPERAQSRPLNTRGAVHDLQAMFDTLNARYFGNAIQARIGWGRGTSSERRRRSIRMGAYYHETQTILIHPALDRTDVPQYFVSLVVYHEMLHQAVPQQKMDTGRRTVHSREFRAREKLFHDFDRARLWERHNLSILLRPSRPRRSA